MVGLLLSNKTCRSPDGSTKVTVMLSGSLCAEISTSPPTAMTAWTACPIAGGEPRLVDLTPALWHAANDKHESQGGLFRTRRVTDPAGPWVEVRDQDIVVTMAGTSLRVVYRKPQRGSQLVPSLDYFQDQQRGPRAEFLARALEAANKKACELGRCVTPQKEGPGRQCQRRHRARRQDSCRAN
jgi:hypothetical protein